MKPHRDPGIRITTSQWVIDRMLRSQFRATPMQRLSVNQGSQQAFSAQPVYAGMNLLPALEEGSPPTASVSIGLVDASYGGLQGLQALLTLTGPITVVAQSGGNQQAGLMLSQAVPSWSGPFTPPAALSDALMAALAENIALLPLSPPIPPGQEPFAVRSMSPWVVANPNPLGGSTQLNLVLNTSEHTSWVSGLGFESFVPGANVNITISPKNFMLDALLSRYAERLQKLSTQSNSETFNFDFSDGTWSLVEQPQIKVAIYTLTITVFTVTVSQTLPNTLAFHLEFDLSSGPCGTASGSWDGVTIFMLTQGSISYHTQGELTLQPHEQCKGAGPFIEHFIRPRLAAALEEIQTQMQGSYGLSIAAFGDFFQISGMRILPSGALMFWGTAEVDLPEYGTFLANLGNTGEYAAQVMPGTDLLWQYSLPSASIGYPPFLVADSQRLYLVDGAGALLALDPLTGSTVWTAQGNNFYSPPTVLGGLVLAVSGTDSTAQLQALSASDGSPSWKLDCVAWAQSNLNPVFPLSASPTHTLVQRSGSTQDVGLVDLSNGTFSALSGINNSVSYPPMARLDTQIYLAGAGWVQGWNLASMTASSVEMSFDPSLGWNTPVLAAQGLLYGVLSNGLLVCMDPVNGNPVNPSWTFDTQLGTGQGATQLFAVAEGVAVAQAMGNWGRGTDGLYLVGLNASTGALIWATPAPPWTQIGNGVAISDGYVYGSIGGQFSALSLANGKPNAAGVSWGPAPQNGSGGLLNVVPPLLAHQNLYVLDSGAVWAFGIAPSASRANSTT